MPKGEFLGEFEQLVMLAVLRLEKNAYGMTVRREIERIADRSATLGSVYGTLDRLEQKGYISSSNEDPDPVRGGHPRRYFRVETEGATALVNSREMMKKMWSGVKVAIAP